jgi:hypothetical protein
MHQQMSNILSFGKFAGIHKLFADTHKFCCFVSLHYVRQEQKPAFRNPDCIEGKIIPVITRTKECVNNIEHG